MSDPHHAGHLLYQALSRFFPRLAPHVLHSLGQEIYSCVAKRLHREGLRREDAQDVFQDVLLAATRYLQRHGGDSVSELRGWLHTIARNSAAHHLKKLFGTKEKPYPTMVSLESLLEGEAEYYLPPAPPVMTHDGDELERLICQAIHRLHGRNREFAERHFIRRQSPEEIIRAMELPSHRSFQRLQRQTLKLLVEILKGAFAYTLATSWVA